MPAPFFRIEMLPARHGDCLWVEYGEGDDTHRLLIDGGPVSTFDYIKKRLDRVPMGERAFELIVLSHVDADHVEGLVRLFAEQPLPFAVDRVWFNGWRQMKKSHGLLGALQGEFLSALLARRVPRAWKPDAPPWVVLKDGKLPATTLPGGLKLTLVSPTPSKLQQMAKAWEKAMDKAGIEPGDLDAAWQKLAQTKKFIPKQGLLGAAPNLDALLKAQFVRDQAAPNGSSIAFLAEYAGKSALFLADAHPDAVAASLKRLCKERRAKRLKVDAVKVSHHGSKNNTNDELLSLVESPRWLISTNGDQFKHPDKPCIARILKLAKPDALYFNYRSEYTKPWIAAAAQKKFGYRAIVRPESATALEVPL
ncbi:MAG: ComEC/Rec2 family competence protein [Alphaproteobacteria bacterium]